MAIEIKWSEEELRLISDCKGEINKMTDLDSIISQLKPGGDLNKKLSLWDGDGVYSHITSPTWLMALVIHLANEKELWGHFSMVIKNFYKYKTADPEAELFLGIGVDGSKPEALLPIRSARYMSEWENLYFQGSMARKDLADRIKELLMYVPSLYPILCEKYRKEIYDLIDHGWIVVSS